MTRTRHFEGLTVAVVGGGRGLGRQYCLDLGREGANVLVISSSESAQAVANQIVAESGTAKYCVADARNGQKIVDSAIDHFGNLDCMIVNAGIVRDRSFAKMSAEDWTEVLSVHVDGAFSCAKAAWGPMCEQGGGSILLTTSGAGMHGNFGQANYSAAKAAIIGFAKSLAAEGKRHGIRVNAIAPMALTEMTEKVFTPELKKALPASDVSPFALALLHPDTKDTGIVVETGGGWASCMRWERSAGLELENPSFETVMSSWTKIKEFSDDSDYPSTTADSLMGAMTASSRTKENSILKRKGSNDRQS